MLTAAKFSQNSFDRATRFWTFPQLDLLAQPYLIKRQITTVSSNLWLALVLCPLRHQGCELQPVFVSIANYDFSLQSASGVIAQRASCGSAFINTDPEGNPRPVRSGFDISCPGCTAPRAGKSFCCPRLSG